MLSRKPFLSGAFACVLAVGLTSVMGLPAATQGVSPQQSQTAAAADVPLTAGVASLHAGTEGNDPVREAEAVKAALGACFGGVDGVPSETRVQVGFRLEGQGQLAGLPEFQGPAPMSAADRRLYLAGATALDRCAPFPVAGEEARFEAVFSADGIETVRRVDTPDQPSAATVGRIASAVNAQADEASENSLSLSRDQRTEVQRRLRVLGFDPQGADGVFGDRTRAALSDWQTDKGFAATGYLNAVQLLALNAQSQAAYEEELAKDPPQSKRRVKVCRAIGVLGLKRCHYEYR